MTEELDLESNNLCIPEDAFEKFQAVSMYQEEKYIVLPQIGSANMNSPEPNVQSADSVAKEVVKSSDNIRNNPASNTEVDCTGETLLNSTCLDSTVDIGDGPGSEDSAAKIHQRRRTNSNKKNNYECDTEMVISSSENVNNLENTALVSPSNSYASPRKRGRKPKKAAPIDDLSMGLQKNIQNPDISSTPFSSDLDTSDTITGVKKKKRGRPPKALSNEQSSIAATNSEKDPSSELSSSDNNRNEDLLIKKSSRRRGRPKGSGRKLSIETNHECKEEASVLENQTIEHVEPVKDLDIGHLNTSNETIKKKRKRKRESSPAKFEKEDLDSNLITLDSDSKKLSDNISDTDDLDDVCLSKLKSVSEQSDMDRINEENSSTDNKLDNDLNTESNDLEPNKEKKRRGRPKKVPGETQIPVNSEPDCNNLSLNDITNIEEDEADDMCLSKLKTNSDNLTQIKNNDITEVQDPICEVQVPEIEQSVNKNDVTPTKRNTKMPVMADFEYNIDSVIGQDTTENSDHGADNSLLVEDTSKRPNRRKIRKFQYEEESDEDPFANVELSDDDEPRRGRRGNKYYSDDEYIPGKRGNKEVESTDTEMSDNEQTIKLDDTKKQRRRKSRKKSENQSPRKRGKKGEEPKPDATPVELEDTDQSRDVEICVEPSVIKASNGDSQSSQKWGTTTEFENFLAKKIQGTNLQIKKVSSESNKIDIPVIDADAKKTIEMCTQTKAIPTTSTAVQTTAPHDIPLKENIALTPEQSEKACYLLNSIVKTTAELGLLMTQKSEDFMKKKINTNHVTDTSKMDYCVKKSFLLFKLAKHNLLEMEENLAKQYDEFLKSNGLSKCREEQKAILPTSKEANSDSDCEIVEVNPSPQIKPSPKSQPKKPAFNPKTVFLNKELSIKIAKKPNESKKLDIKGRHTVWINDTVMVKKVKPTQSFLAQDSRNKKPPDYCITIEMVSDFFKNYYRQRAVTVCVPFVSTDWLKINKECVVCNYFVVQPLPFNTDTNYSESDQFSLTSTASNNAVSEPSHSLTDVMTVAKNSIVSSPEPLFKLCFRILKSQLHHGVISHNEEVTHKIRNELTDGQSDPVTLFRLCLRTINNSIISNIEIGTSCIPEFSNIATRMGALQPLKTLCHRRIISLLADSCDNDTESDQVESDQELYINIDIEDSSNTWFPQVDLQQYNRTQVKSLFSLCVEYIQGIQYMFKDHNGSVTLPKTLKTITFESVTNLLYKHDLDTNQHDNGTAIESLMINCVNTLSEEAFLNLEQYDTETPHSSDYQDDFDNDDNLEAHADDVDDDQTEPSWVSQVQMQELRSCATNNLEADEQQEMAAILTEIKIEPLDDLNDNLIDIALVKSEPIPGLDEMTIIPDVKPEIEENIHPAPLIQRQNSNSYDEDTFESFVSSSKLMRALTEYDTETIYSQSSERVRRQHEPDFYADNNTDMLGLLVPHTYEPINVQTAKGSLMESSSDETSKNTKGTTKKVIIKRSKRRPKKPEPKPKTKDIPAAPPVPQITKEKDKITNSEVAILTRRMKERIRQEDKKNESTDSENENVTVRLRSREKKDTNDQAKDKSKPTTTEPSSKSNEIQCNNVDSTDQLDNGTSFPGFTPIETNEMTNYEKYMKFVYDQVNPEKDMDKKKVKIKDDKKQNNETPLICPNEPVELLECEPTLPIFEESKDNTAPPQESKADDTVSATSAAPLFTERHGWQCYPVDLRDTKLCQRVCLYLEKLPEAFVQTYFEYQNINIKDKSDEEIDRLTNLSSLNRVTNVKDKKPQNILSKKDTKDQKPGIITEDDNQAATAVESDHYDELVPSDNELPTLEDNLPQPVLRQEENSLAKNSLMDDKESDDEAIIKFKKEPIDNISDVKKPKPLSKKKTIVPEENTDLMLTADKVMNKELTLLHAPVVMDNNVQKTPAKGPVTRHNKKSATKVSPTDNKTKTEEDSSSEEEKQWVSTKEKLLKRLGKKESPSADDAKRAKLVSEFIERREGNPDSHKRRGGRGPRRSAKKFLEREKQLRVLQRELFGEMSNDPTVGKRSVASWKGRRNIRKVLDKKSLARSTVIANMEEFERKRRLNARQTKLTELLGCEEGVNVLVINDEVCLEYDFAEHRPVVTIHPFFTKVMKAHQYEGVKFMWDACFESLSDIEAGHAGGGCILAHCMGLGKTLQVLALLHTVLTHPRVGMHRVLVCCPLSTVLNWVDEIHKWIGPVTNQIKVFELSKLKKTYERAYQLEDWYNGGGIFIIGYELFRSLSTLDPILDDVRPTIVNKIRTALLDPGPDIVVCDEGHLLKNDCSVLAVAMSRVVTKRRIVLTGTPMQNNLREYYCMVNFVKPNLLGTYAEYSNRFENPIMNGQHRDSREEDIKLMKARTHILHKVLEGCLQRQEASVLYPYLPKKHEYTVFITLTKCQWDLYKHYLNHYSRQMKQNSILKDFHILQKIWSHPQVLHNFQTKAQENRNKVKLEKLEDDLATEDQEDIKDSVATELWWLQYLEGGDMLDSLESSNKFVVVFRILDECVALGDKVLIFSTSLFCLDALEYFLKKINKWSLGQEYYRLDGSVPPEVRQKWCREFNAENNINTKLFLISTRAGCLGLNMTAANRVIIMDTSWNPAHDIQSIFRVYRFGQKKDCFIYRLVAMGTMEQKIYERSVTKQAIACRVVDEQQIDRHYNMAELTELYRYDEAGASVAGGVAVGVSDVALLRVARDSALHAVHEHDSLLRSSEQGLPEHERAAAWMQFQQEQAHKQMENKLIANIPKISLKRLQGEEYANVTDLQSIKQEIKIEDTSENFALSETKSKRSKKITKVVIPIPDSKAGSSKSQLQAKHTEPMKSKLKERLLQEKPRTSKRNQIQENTQSDEEELVDKITAMLIKHDFHNKKESADIKNLICNVKKIIKQGGICKDDPTDSLSASIAKLLLPQGMTVPALTGIMCESISNTSTPLPSQPPPNKEPENTQSTPLGKEVNVPDTRRKRKAALAAVKHIDSIAQNIIILDDDLDSSDTDFVPNERTEKHDKQQNSKRKSNSKEATPQKMETEVVKNVPTINNTKTITTTIETTAKTRIYTHKPGPKAFKEKIQQKYKELTKSIDKPPNEESRSILLSDDDDIPLSKSRSTTSQDKLVANSSTEDDEIIPLPLSLLTNKNFINIVAHTYLNGNPMLDADAATLAAQYSTLKSLKEAEETGKDIVSGPIYDIAAKVIGKNLFKKMNGANLIASSTSEDAALVTSELKEKMAIMTQHNSKEDKASKTRKKKEEKKKSTTKTETSNSDIIEITDSLQKRLNGEVVPVGLIKTADGVPPDEYASSECILPDDDDDVHIVPHDMPNSSQLHSRPAPIISSQANAMISLHSTTTTASTTDAMSQAQAKTQPVILNHMLTSTQKSKIDSKPHIVTTPNVIKISKGKIILPASAITEKSSQSNKSTAQETSSSFTICLDSDEEETVAPNPVAYIPPASVVNIAPVPVSLSLCQPSETIVAESSNLKPLVSTQGVPQSPLILRQVAVGAAPKYVLVPASNFSSLTPVTKLPKLLPKESPKPIPILPKEKPTTRSPQIKPTTDKIESILSTTTPSAVCLNKIKQARCKPGDIIKISEKGEIEVLQTSQLNSAVPSSTVTSNTVAASTSSRSEAIKSKLTPTVITKTKSSLTVPKPSSSSVLKPKSSSIEVSKPKPNEVAKPKSFKIEVTKPKPPLLKPSGVSQQMDISSKTRTLSISSSSDSSRPSSPVDNNPLSILKDVVHIQAADETPNISFDKVNASKNYKGQSSTQTSKTNDLNKSQVKSIPSKDTIMITKQSKPKDVVKPSGGSAKNNKMLTDLLNKKSLALRMSNSGESKPGTSASGVKTTVAETSSNNKKVLTYDLTSHFGSVKSGSGATMLKTRIEAKKRVSNTETTTTPKKKKTEPMTLKDFNIDDIDDIIELE